STRLRSMISAGEASSRRALLRSVALAASTSPWTWTAGTVPPEAAGAPTGCSWKLIWCAVPSLSAGPARAVGQCDLGAENRPFRLGMRGEAVNQLQAPAALIGPASRGVFQPAAGVGDGH